MKRFFSVLICFCFCFSIFVGNVKRTEAAVIDASALFLANSALTYAEASGMHALVSGMTAAEVGTAFSASTVSGYAASVGTTEAALATTVGAGIVITPKTILITAAAAAVLAGIIAYCINQNADLEEVDTPVVLSDVYKLQGLDGYPYTQWSFSATEYRGSNTSGWWFNDNIGPNSTMFFTSDLSSYPVGISVLLKTAMFSNNHFYEIILRKFGSNSGSLIVRRDGSTLLCESPLGDISASVVPISSGFLVSNPYGYLYEFSYGHEYNTSNPDRWFCRTGTQFSNSSGFGNILANSSLSLSRSSTYELPTVGETDSVLITIPEDSSVTLDPTASADTILDPIVNDILTVTIADRPDLTAEVISEPQIEEPDIPENIETPWLPDIVPPWHYVVQLIEDASDFISVWFQTINTVLPDSLSNSIWAAVVLIVTFGIINRFLE